MNSSSSNRDQIAASISSRYLVFKPDGSEVELDLNQPASALQAVASVGDPALLAYFRAEELGGEEREAPPSIKIMQQQQLVGYEAASDSGHFRLYPKGKLIFDLLKSWAKWIAVEKLGAMEIESPLLYDWADGDIREQAGSFHENHYVVKVPDDPDREFVLRFAGDFGLFKIMKAAQFSHKHLPLRVYEFSKSFRYERSGALAGLKRLRAFHMPDLHSFCRDLDQSWEEYQHLYRSYADLAVGAEINYALCFRIVREFYDQHRERIVELLHYSKRPALIEVLSAMKHYWAVKNEFQAIDSVGGNVQLSTVQLDVRDAEVYGIKYVDRDGLRKGCVICHSSVGSVERWLYAVLEQALMRKPAQLPVWLAPAQLRILPVSPDQLEYCEALKFAGLRSEIDDSAESLGKRIARANKEWVPYVAVVGADEMLSGKLSVSIRASGLKAALDPAELSELIQDECAGKPLEALSLPRHLSRRPQFW